MRDPEDMEEAAAFRTDEPCDAFVCDYDDVDESAGLAEQQLEDAQARNGTVN